MSSPSGSGDQFLGIDWAEVKTAMPEQWARYPTDLAVFSGLVAIGALLATLLPAGSVPRFLLALPLVFLAPGYALVALLYPTAESSPTTAVDNTIVKIVLAFGLSFALVPVILLVIGGIQTLGDIQVVGGVTLVTLIIAQLAAMRRNTTTRDQWSVRQLQHLPERPANALRGRDRLATVSAVLLGVALVVATATLVLAVSHPPAAHDFTQFYIGTEDSDGSLNTSSYPTELTGETPLVVGVSNQQGTSIDYVVVVQLQEVSDDGDILASERVGLFENTVADGEDWEHAHEITPAMEGDGLRLQYLLFRDTPPETPTQDNAIEYVHIWVDVD